jgi:adenylate cyclase
MDAVDRALALNPDLAEAHAVRAQLLQIDGKLDAAIAESTAALALDAESYEVNRSSARLHYQLSKFVDAARFYEKAVALIEADINSAAMLVSCYTALGDAPAIHRAAELTLHRTEPILERDPNNSVVTAYSVDALAALGENERAKMRMERALLIDPDNFNMRYNFACMLAVRLNDETAALEMLTPLFQTISISFLGYAKADPDLESLHDDPRYQAMVAQAEARLVAQKDAPESGTPSRG